MISGAYTVVPMKWGCWNLNYRKYVTSSYEGSMRNISNGNVPNRSVINSSLMPQVHRRKVNAAVREGNVRQIHVAAFVKASSVQVRAVAMETAPQIRATVNEFYVLSNCS